MHLLAFGLNHTTAPVEIREQVNFSSERAKNALHDIVMQNLAQEVVIVSTCNRTEIYCVLSTDNTEAMLRWLSQYHSISLDELYPHLYIYTCADEVIHHLFRVVCGLDSMILGEPQILGQIKDAYLAARKEGTVKRFLTKLFEHSFTVAKQVRTDTAIGSSPVSVAFAAVRLAQQIFGELNNYTALLIGAGETIELAARHLRENKLGRMIVANRTVEKARQLATEFAGFAITLDEIPAHLAEADIIIASTGSPQPLLYKPDVERAIKLRKHRPIFMVDIAVPRDIDAAISELEDVYLYTVDDLNEVIQEGLRSREQAARQAEEIIDTHVSHFVGWLNSLSAVDTIRDLREQAQETRQDLVIKAKKMLDNGKSPHEVVEFLAHNLTNKLLHSPCVQLRQASYDGQLELLVAAKQLFQLSNKD